MRVVESQDIGPPMRWRIPLSEPQRFAEQRQGLAIIEEHGPPCPNVILVSHVFLTQLHGTPSVVTDRPRASSQDKVCYRASNETVVSLVANARNGVFHPLSLTVLYNRPLCCRTLSDRT